MADSTEPENRQGRDTTGGTVTDPGKAVFLSYASQDAEPAHRLCNALRAGGIEVWFDQSELRGGDVWDQNIRREIRDCALFIPVISANTASRHEGYFRLEWDLADQRTHMLARNRAFIVPVCLDATPDAGADVPESFRRVQWTRLPGGEAPPEFVRRIEQLLSGEVRASNTAAQGPAAVASRRPSRGTWLAVAVTIVIAAAAAYLLVEKPWVARHPTPAAFGPPAHSIAVLPFVNMSEDKEQDYFSDGLTEELLNSLTEIDGLQVAARTSAFSFKGKDTDIGTIARKLNVGAVLEGSVRRAGNTVRITVQLINAVTGFHLWSHTYDRDLGDVLKLETEIATAVTSVLKVSLLADVATKIELGGTHNSAAFDAYLRGKKIGRTALKSNETQATISAYTEAIQLDPDYALAFAERSLELSDYASFNAEGSAAREAYERASADAHTALSLAPALADGHYAMAVVLGNSLEFGPATDEFRRALELAPGSARMLVAYSRNAATMGHAAEAIDAGRRAITLDPLNFHVYRGVGIALKNARHFPEAVTAFRTSISLEPGYVRNHALLGEVYYAMGNFDDARAECELASADAVGQRCLAMTYERLGRHADAEAMLRRLESSSGDEGALDYACIYAQWRDKAKALQWLETGVRRRDSGLAYIKVDSDFDPLRDEPRFRAIEQELKFP
jgi:TolB-like protein/cytochrome c-type biogenesis protein CcmH/NrfG